MSSWRECGHEVFGSETECLRCRIDELKAAYEHTVEDNEDLVRQLDAVKLEVKLNPSGASKELQSILEQEQGND